MSYLSDPRNHPHKQLPEYFGTLPPAALFGAGLAFLDGSLWLSDATAWAQVAAANGDQTVEGTLTTQAVTVEGAFTAEDAATFEAGVSFEAAVQVNAPLTAESQSTGVVISAIASTLDDAVTITAISKAAQAVITAADHGLVEGDKIFVDGVVGMTEINDLILTVVSTDGDDVTVDVDSTDFTTYVSDGTLAALLDTADVTATGHTFRVGDTVRFSAVVGMTQINGESAAVTAVDGNDFTADIDVREFTTYASAGLAKGITTISTGVTGGLIVTSAIGTPATPAAGKVVLWWDETAKMLKIKDSAGTIETIVEVTA